MTDHSGPEQATSVAQGGRRVIAHNFLWLTAAQVAGRVVGLFTGIYIRRVLEATVIGQYSWCLSVLSYFSLLINPGLETVAKRDVARDPSQAARLFSQLLALQLTLVVIACGLVVVFVVTGWRGPIVNRLLVLLAIGLLFMPFNLTWLLQAHERMAPAAIAQVVAQILQVPTLVWLVREPAHVVRYAVLSYPFQLGLIGFLCWYTTRHRLLQWSEVRPAFRGAWPLIEEALPLGLSQMAILLYYNSDAIMLGVWSNDHTVGIYSTAYQMMLMPLLLAGALYTAYFPQLAKKHADPQQSASSSNELLHLLIWMGFPLAALGWAFGRHVIVLLYGAGFSESGPLFEWLSLNLALVFVNNGIGSPLLAWGRQRLHFCITAVAAALNVALNLVLIPHYGAWGAVITTILAEAVVTVVCLIVRRKNVPVVMSPSGWWAIGCAILLAVMLKLLVVWFPRWWCGSLAIGLIAFAACFWWREKEVLLHLARTRL